MPKEQRQTHSWTEKDKKGPNIVVMRKVTNSASWTMNELRKSHEGGAKRKKLEESLMKEKTLSAADFTRPLSLSPRRSTDERLIL